MNGSGEITLIVDMTIVELSDVNREITIDSVLQEAYSGNPSMNSCVSGNFPSFPPGNSLFAQVGGGGLWFSNAATLSYAHLPFLMYHYMPWDVQKQVGGY